MRLTARGVARAAAAALAGLIVGVVVMVFGKSAVGAFQPDRGELVAVVEAAVPPGAELVEEVHFSEAIGWGNLVPWYPPVPGEAVGDVVGADIDEVGRHLISIGLEPTTSGRLPTYDRGSILVRLAEVGLEADVSIVARLDTAWWMFLHGPIGALAGLATGWQILRRRPD